MARGLHRSIVVFACLALALIGTIACSSDPPRRDCFARIWVPADGVPTSVVGSWNDYATPGIAPHRHIDGFLLARLDLPPGEYGYLLRRDGKLVLDPSNPLTAFRPSDEREVSLLVVQDCSQPAFVGATPTVDGDRLVIEAQFVASDDEEPLDPDRVKATLADGTELRLESADPDTGQVRFEGTGLVRGRHVVTLSGADEEGVLAEPKRVAAWIEPRHERWEDAIVYQVMIDRFRGDGGAPLDPPPNPGARAGGTLSGVTAMLESGYFDELGITALWLSPVYLNPDEARLGVDGQLYEGYHGYWVLGSRDVDPRLGGEAALDELVESAQSRGIAVLFDLVPNHVYEGNPVYQGNADSWFYPGGCVCGTADCPWGEYIQTCWFTDYLPDLRWENPDAFAFAVEEAQYWAQRYNVDGFRIDAVPMMRRAATRRIAHELRTSTVPAESTFLLGEVFTGPGEGALGNLKVHLGPNGLNSVFDFPLMWELREVVGRASGSFADIESLLEAEREAFDGSGAVIGRMLDNHDVSRFISDAVGDGGNHPWEEPPPQPADAEPYQRMELAYAYLYGLEGYPVLYYGDEIGLAGATDPDCRRVMPADEELFDPQQELRGALQRLGSLRTCSEALRRGDRTPRLAEPQRAAFVRGSDTDAPALLVFNAATTPVTFEVQQEALPQTLVDALDGTAFTAEGGSFTVDLDGLGYRVLLPSGDACLP